MKVLFCKNCCSFVVLSSEEKFCECGKTSGKYLDPVSAEYSGNFAIPLIFKYGSLISGIEKFINSGSSTKISVVVSNVLNPTFRPKN